ncbi:hypothetical protein J6590_030624 [Homalodisca vitripennis]|nr:hypothetical protein J6590_030624 [Homalodisca vitripennis]
MNGPNHQGNDWFPLQLEIAVPTSPHKPGTTRKMIGSPRQLENAVPTSKNPHGVWSHMNYLHTQNIKSGWLSNLRCYFQTRELALESRSKYLHLMLEIVAVWCALITVTVTVNVRRAKTSNSHMSSPDQAKLNLNPCTPRQYLQLVLRAPMASSTGRRHFVGSVN